MEKSKFNYHITQYVPSHEKVTFNCIPVDN